MASGKALALHSLIRLAPKCEYPSLLSARHVEGERVHAELGLDRRSYQTEEKRRKEHRTERPGRGDDIGHLHRGLIRGVRSSVSRGADADKVGVACDHPDHIILGELRRLPILLQTCSF